MVVPYSVGSQTDVVARMVGQKMAEHWGQQVLVDNRPSAGGVIAAGAVASASPDGYTLLFHGKPFAISAALYSKLPYDVLRDFAGVSETSSSTFFLLVVTPSLNVRSVSELIALAKLKPGRMSFGSAGIGSSAHLAGEQFRFSAGIEAVHVPFKGTPEALTDVMAGRVQYFVTAPLPALPLVKDGRLLALAVTSAQRSPALPEVPAVAESLPGFEFEGWTGLWAPARTPRTILDQLSGEMARIAGLPDVAERLHNQALVPRASTPGEFDRFVRSEVEKARMLIKASGARAE
jgi:tripartite-type tricarboxylate transporter receptor subunit TctC